MTYAERAVCDGEPCYHCVAYDVERMRRRRAEIAAQQIKRNGGRCL